MGQAIQRRVQVHDRYQLEFKLGYPLTPGKETRYLIDTYIFAPWTLGINSTAYQSGDFYHDIQNYVRLMTPRLSLAELVDSPESPLATCERLLWNAEGALGPDAENHLITNLKFLRAIMKSALQAHLRPFVVSLPGRPQAAARYDLAQAVDRLVTLTGDIAERFRRARVELDRLTIGRRPLQSWTLTDEAISLVIEEGSWSAYQVVDRYLDGEQARAVKQQLARHIEAETDYRTGQGYGSVLNRSGDNEDYLTRISFLKKYTSSVLWLSTATEQEGTTLEQILFALVAGVSMFFATVVAFAFQARFGAFTFPVFVALVVGYMFKDRIKEQGRQLAMRYRRRFRFDKRVVISAPDGRHRLGFLREKMTYVPEREIPAPVMAARDRDPSTELSIKSLGEAVIHYTKEVVLAKDAFRYVELEGLPIDAINDIMRYDIHAFLRKMDNPVQRKPMLDNGELRLVKCHKTYQLNFISVYRTDDVGAAPIYERVRVILDRKGICRIEMPASGSVRQFRIRQRTSEEQYA